MMDQVGLKSDLEYITINPDFLGKHMSRSRSTSIFPVYSKHLRTVKSPGLEWLDLVGPQIFLRWDLKHET